MPPTVASTSGNGNTLRIMPTKVAVVVLALAATTIAGCQDSGATQQAAAKPATNGVAALTADEILQRAKDAAKKAKTFRAAGTTPDDGGSIKVDLRVDGAEFSATMPEGAANMELLAVGGKKYFRANEPFWVMTTDAKQGKTLATSFGSRWIAGAEDDASFNSLFSVGALDEMLAPTGTMSKGAEKEIEGVPAIGLKDAGDVDSLLWIATTGEPYPVRMDGKGDAKLVFSGFGAPVTGITQPPAAQIVFIGQGQGK
jgi:hypothetical protein